MTDSNISMNPWKLSTIGLLVIGATALTTTFVVGQKSPVETAKETQSQLPGAHKTQHATNPTTGHAQPSHAVAANSTERTQPSQAEIEACNKSANDQVTSKTTELVKDGGVGAVLGAAVGAVGGAIAGGGKGAGEGAAIGGIIGATSGTLYGMNENKANDEKYQAAYASCMHAKGYPA